MNESDQLVRTGRVWTFGDNINTDLIMPNTTFKMPQSEHHKMVFSANRPGWVDLVEPGDLLVAGANFGLGSGRPVGRLLGECGIRGVIAESFNGVALRNCVNFGMPPLECRGILAFVEEGQMLSVDYNSGLVTNQSTGQTIQGKPLPGLLGDIVLAGGVYPMLMRQGFIEDHPTYASAV